MTSTSALPMLALDFDGVIHSHTSGWRGAKVIPDPPVTGAIAFLAEATARARVAIYSGRACHAGGVRAMEAWLAAELAAARLDQAERWRILDSLEWWRDKPPALVLLDDRAMTFTGAWPALDELLAFQPWNRRAA